MPNELTVQTPSLRIFRRLDVNGLSNEFKDVIGKEEGDFEYVDGDKARDFAWTEEIMDNTVGAALVDADGNVLHEFEGPRSLAQAEQARGSAKITFSIDFDRTAAAEDDDDDEDGHGQSGQ